MAAMRPARLTEVGKEALGVSKGSSTWFREHPNGAILSISIGKGFLEQLQAFLQVPAKGQTRGPNEVLARLLNHGLARERSRPKGQRRSPKGIRSMMRFFNQLIALGETQGLDVLLNKLRNCVANGQAELDRREDSEAVPDA